MFHVFWSCDFSLFRDVSYEQNCDSRRFALTAEFINLLVFARSTGGNAVTLHGIHNNQLNIVVFPSVAQDLMTKKRRQIFNVLHFVFRQNVTERSFNI